MNIGSALGFPVAAPSVKRTDATKSVNDSDAPRSAASSAQFAAFLSMIVANNPKVRSDLLKQLPEDGAGLLDHLLADSEVLSEGAEQPSVFANTAGTLAQLPNSSTMASAMPFAANMDAVDSARYGMIVNTARASVEAAPAKTLRAETPVLKTASVKVAAQYEVAAPVNNTDVASPAIAKAEVVSEAKPVTKSARITITSADINSALLAEVNSSIAAMQTGSPSSLDKDDNFATLTRANSQGRLSQAVLGRIASKKGVSVEQMMAIGDTEGAQARQALDALLAKAGTQEGMNIVAVNAASTALSAALAASASNVTSPVRDMDALDPELQTRLARVMERMKTEFGHDVTVVETARSQERQDMLFEQGRSTPGKVVTWTKDSLHTQGEAVDVVVDGSWNNAKGFSRLADIAKEEGLHQIPNDPGHLELPKDSWSTNPSVRVQSMTNVAPNAQLPNMQTPNGVARVATVARVAQVASAANTSAPITIEAPQLPKAPNTPLDASLGLTQQQRDASAGSKNTQNGTFDSSSDEAPKRSVKSADKTSAHPSAAHLSDETAQPPKFIGPVDEVNHAEAKPVNGADRIQQIDSLREQQGVKPISQITLEVDGVDGNKQQITVGVNGKVVDTHITADGTSADRMRSHVNELKSGLESRGLEADSVRISTQGARTNDATEGVKTGVERDALRMQGTGNASASTGDQSMHQGTRDRSSSAREWEDKQAARDEQRAQHRDAQGRGSGNQDRQQRPQYQEKK